MLLFSKACLYMYMRTVWVTSLLNEDLPWN